MALGEKKLYIPIRQDSSQQTIGLAIKSQCIHVWSVTDSYPQPLKCGINVLCNSQWLSFFTGFQGGAGGANYVMI